MTFEISTATGTEMLRSVTPIYTNDDLALSVFEANGKVMHDIAVVIEGLTFEMYPQNATWTIDYWEQMLGIKPNKNLLNWQRVQKVLFELNKYYTITRHRMEIIVNEFIENKNATVVDIDGEYAFRVIIPMNNEFINSYSDLKKTVEEMKPAHLKAIFILLDKIEAERKVVHKILLKKKIRPETTWWGGQYNPGLGMLINGSWHINGGFLLNASASEEDPINKVFFRETLKTEKVFNEYEEDLALILDGNWTLNNVHTLDNPPKLVKLRPIEHDLTIFERKVYERRIDGTWHLDGSMTVGVQRLMNGSWIMDGEYLMDGNRMQKL
ncbi:hypothetical protein CSV80_00895 [Sporosarcina sp. P12(2017)]|uniref:putative phage tail protein n=1 Tax=unclassified Sporosarcina TaxID=2647733 RepID=UPI000C16758D|nr:MULTISPECIES: putative phage tail protein [unclassified Sporosarcina]PIC59113.1 hypothetical protein CSV81_00895 [Sporosarcina sp. P10]PIC62434.1 hypothetical protein CSV80_00895 [Sporosarcina sp. P12(2017)]